MKIKKKVARITVANHVITKGCWPLMPTSDPTFRASNFLDLTKKICSQLSVVNLQEITGSIWTSKVPMDFLGPGKRFKYSRI